MPRRIREYHRPADLDGALELLRRRDVSTVPLWTGPRPVALADRDAEAVVDLSAAGLAYVRETEAGQIRVGAMTPLQDLAESPLLKSRASGVLAEAAHLSGHAGLRRLASLGGALADREGPPEVALALLALDAAVIVRAESEINLPLSQFLTRGLGEGEVVLAAVVPRLPEAGLGAALERLARTPRDQAIVAAAAVVEMQAGKCRRARLATAAGGLPQRLRSAEALLEGHALSDERIRATASQAEGEIQPRADFRASAEYRRAMTGVLIRRALSAARRRAAAGE